MITIFQTNNESVMFRMYDEEKVKANIDSYEMVYTDVLNTYTGLEDIFKTFNVFLPVDYHARSLSVSDIVVIVNDKIMKSGVYYCDAIGWKSINAPSLYAKAEKACQAKIEKGKYITGVYIQPNEEAKITLIDPSLESLQNMVNGYIEMFYPFPEEVAIICNDEGKYNGSLPNRAIYDANGEIMDIIFGSFLIVGIGEDGEFTSLTEEQQKHYYEMFKSRETMVYENGTATMIKQTAE